MQSCELAVIKHTVLGRYWGWLSTFGTTVPDAQFQQIVQALVKKRRFHLLMPAYGVLTVLGRYWGWLSTFGMTVPNANFQE